MAVDSEAHGPVDSQRISLLRVALNLFIGDRYQVSKQTLRRLAWPGRKVKLRCGSFVRVEAVGRRAVGRTHAPNSLDGKGLSAGILEQAIEFAGCKIISGDESCRLRGSSSGEIRNEKVVAEASKIERSESNSPWSIKPVAMLKAPE